MVVTASAEVLKVLLTGCTDAVGAAYETKKRQGCLQGSCVSE